MLHGVQGDFPLRNSASRLLQPNMLTEAIIVKKDFSIWGPGVSWELPRPHKDHSSRNSKHLFGPVSGNLQTTEMLSGEAERLCPISWVFLAFPSLICSPVPSLAHASAWSQSLTGLGAGDSMTSKGQPDRCTHGVSERVRS